MQKRWTSFRAGCLVAEQAASRGLRRTFVKATTFLTVASVVAALLLTPGLWDAVRRTYRNRPEGFSNQDQPLAIHPNIEEVYNSTAGSVPTLPLCNSDGSYRNIKVVIARLIGNNMPPLQGVDQLKNNVEFILEQEDPMVAAVIKPSRPNQLRSIFEEFETISSVIGEGRAQHRVVRQMGRLETRNVGVNYGASLLQHRIHDHLCDPYDPGEHRFALFVERIWIVNRMVNESAKEAILNLLDDHREAYIEVPLNANFAAQTVEPLLYVTNQNVARNIALQEALSTGARWILPFDGNVFLTEEAWRAALLTLAKAEMLNNKYVFTPMYRFLSEQSNDIINRTSTFPQIATHLARGEVQLMFRNDAPLMFDETVGYGARNKFDLVQDLQKDFLGQILCPNADIGFDLGKWKVNSERQIHKRCAFSVRLSYWSDYERDEWRTLTDAQSRHNRRMTSRAVLSYIIADAIFTESWLQEYGIMLLGAIASFWSGVVTLVFLILLFNRLVPYLTSTLRFCCNSKIHNSNE